MECDYKITKYVRGVNVALQARFYVGETTAQMEDGPDGPVSITRFRRTEKVKEESLVLSGDKTNNEVIQELGGLLASFASEESAKRGVAVTPIPQQEI